MSNMGRIRQAKTDPRDALLIAEVIRFGHFSESTLHPENIYELRELCRGRHAIVSMQADVKRKVVALLDQVFPEYETAFTNMFSDTSMAILQTCPTPKELSEMRLEELCHLIEVSSHKRFRMAKARELQELARSSFGFAMAGDVFSTMIRLYAKHLVFLKQQVQEMDRKIAHCPKIRLKKFGFSLKIVPANIVQKLPSQRCFKPFFIASFNFSHKRRNVRFKGLRRVHTRLCSKNRTQGHTRRNRGHFGWGWYHYPRSVSHGSETLRGRGLKRQTLPLLGLGRGCSQRTQKACGTAMRSCVSLFRRRRGPAGLRIHMP